MILTILLHVFPVNYYYNLPGNNNMVHGGETTNLAILKWGTA